MPGSLVFAPTPGPVPLDDWTRWWAWVPGADWRHPAGPDSTLHGRDRHPVVHVGLEDARAYAEWAGKRLPTEVEWEFAARGGLEQATYAWGDDFMPRGRVMANTWHGEFPWQNLDGVAGTSPVGRFPPNGYGLHDVTGNVWEWTDTVWQEHRGATDDDTGPGRAPASPRGLHAPLTESDRYVTKGGSHLCAPSYCLRYRPAARQGHSVRSSTSHLGFRCVLTRLGRCRPAYVIFSTTPTRPTSRAWPSVAPSLLTVRARPSRPSLGVEVRRSQARKPIDPDPDRMGIRRCPARRNPSNQPVGRVRPDSLVRRSGMGVDRASRAWTSRCTRSRPGASRRPS